MKDSTISILNTLSNEINKLYGFVTVEGDNFGEPAINSGPCGQFAHLFYHAWNKRFDKKIHIVFIMVKNSEECWHVLVRLPNGLLFDGGYGVHDDSKYSEFVIEDMVTFDLKLLDERSYGLEREYPRYCKNFSRSKITALIERFLTNIDKNAV